MTWCVRPSTPSQASNAACTLTCSNAGQASSTTARSSTPVSKVRPDDGAKRRLLSTTGLGDEPIDQQPPIATHVSQLGTPNLSPARARRVRTKGEGRTRRHHGRRIVEAVDPIGSDAVVIPQQWVTPGGRVLQTKRPLAGLPASASMPSPGRHPARNLRRRGIRMRAPPYGDALPISRWNPRSWPER